MTTTAPARVRAGGRSEEVRRRVATACLELLAEGSSDLGPAQVARRSGVTRATIYRWWPSRAALIAEALTEHTGVRLEPPDTGTWAGDVRALAAAMAAFFSDPVEVSQNLIMANGHDPDFEQLVLEHYAPLFAAWRAVVERARSRGDLAPDLDADAVVLALASPLVLVPLLFHRALRADEVVRHADLIVCAAAAPSQ
ncbi:MAG TPA: TetR/AcrR family transcriptional regulator C-terminal ligand-binding domain-containing protein [Acidimicrobiales bacterium]|nr:TetR/AcrR family transcriptional regulator C-terminal ligand-binding domain-containing protein [Acidimicrobiales bacterium]